MDRVRRKGYFFSILIILFMVSLFGMVRTFTQAEQGRTFVGAYVVPLARIHDDVSDDLAACLDINVSLERGSMTLNVTDHLPARRSMGNALSDYKTYLEGHYARRSNADIDLNVTELASDPFLLLDPTGVRYDWDGPEKNSFQIRNFTGSTSAESYDLDLYCNASLTDVFPALNAGSLPLTIDVYANGVLESETDQSVGIGQINLISYTFAGGGSAVVTIGSVNGTSGSLQVEVSGVTCRSETRSKFTVPAEADVDLELPGYINVTLARSTRGSEPILSAV